MKTCPCEHYKRRNDPAPIELGELLRKLGTPWERTPTRHQVIRTGEREPIPLLVRLSVYQRDGNKCRICPERHALSLDHRLPWSAGGCDHSANLRTLCLRHNSERSNWQDGAEFSRPLPTTYWCECCWRHPDLPECLDDYGQPIRPDLNARMWRNGVDLTAAPFVTDEDDRVQCYCAHCDFFGVRSNVYFGPAQQDWLADICHDPAVAA